MTRPRGARFARLARALGHAFGARVIPRESAWRALSLSLRRSDQARRLGQVYALAICALTRPRGARFARLTRVFALGRALLVVSLRALPRFACLRFASRYVSLRRFASRFSSFLCASLRLRPPLSSVCISRLESAFWRALELGLLPYEPVRCA